MIFTVKISVAGKKVYDGTIHADSSVNALKIAMSAIFEDLRGIPAQDILVTVRRDLDVKGA